MTEAQSCQLIDDLGAVSEAYYSWSIDEHNSATLHMTVQGPIHKYEFDFSVHNWRWIPDQNLCVCFWPITLMHLYHRPWKIQLQDKRAVQVFMEFITQT